MVTVHFHSRPDLNTQGGRGKFIYKPSILDEKQVHLKQDQLRNHKVLFTLGL